MSPPAIDAVKMREKFRKLHYVAIGERLPVQRTDRPRGLGVEEPSRYEAR